jgi:hypothetical protein
MTPHEKAAKYDKLAEYIKSLGCQADIDMLRIIGPDAGDTAHYEKAKKAVNDLWGKNMPVYGADLSVWPDLDKRFLMIMQSDVNRYQSIYC